MTTTLGTTLACFDDLSPRFAIATSDEQILRDEVYHRLTTDTVLGGSPEARTFGDDVRKLSGQALDVAALGPRYAAALQRSRRIETADVRVTRGPSFFTTVDLFFSVTVVAATDASAFTFLFRLTGTTFVRLDSSQEAA